MTSYKELMMSRYAFFELRNKIRMGLSGFPTTSGGEVLCIDTDPDTEDLLVTWQHEGGQRTHRIVIKDETPSPDSPRGRMVEFLAESDRIIAEQGDVPRETSKPANAHEALVELVQRLGPEPTREEWDAYMDGIARRAGVDVPRETSPED